MLSTCAMVIHMGKFGIFSLFLTESCIIFLSLVIPLMVASLSVTIVTLALVGATMRAVRQAKSLALVEDSHNMTEVEKNISSLLAQI